MDVRGWFAASFTEAVDSDKLGKPRAKQLAALLLSATYDGATLRECWREPKDGHEILVLDVNVPLGQRALVNAVELIEPVVVLIGRDELLPQVYPLREAFPEHVPHFNFAPKEQPRSLCLYEAPSEEVRRTYTALAFMERVRWWFVETAYGRLHGENQPLDPLFQLAGLTLILPRVEEIKPGAMFIAAKVTEYESSPARLIVISPESAAKLVDKQGSYATVYLSTQPVEHGRIRGLPFDVSQLIACYSEIGFDLKTELIAAFEAMHGQPQGVFLLSRPLLLIVETPLTREDGRVEARTVKAYLTKMSAGEVAQFLGALMFGEGYWIRPIGTTLHERDLSQIDIIPADAHDPFDRARARIASGHLPKEHVLVALLGAGAMGSQLAITACRGGYGQWIIVDDDFLLPHNLARHALGPEYLGHSKADALANDLNHMLGRGAAEPIHSNLLNAPDGGRWPGVLREVGQIIDASASVTVARWLACDSEREARAASCFLSPSGKDAVLIIEGANRSTRLDHLEMTYYRHLVSDIRLADHLSGGEIALYVGGCRSPSVKIPQTKVAAFAACAVETVCEQEWPEAGRVSVWRSRDNLQGIDYISIEGELYESCQIGDWTVWVRRALLIAASAARTQAAQFETGGILVGTWDRDRKIIYVVSHYDPPPDSKQEPDGFVRGMVGVYEAIADVHRRTAENLTYIGEWHTHPPGYGSKPSSDDRRLLRWVHDALQWSDAPALILIVGEDGYRFVLKDDATNYQEGFVTPWT